MDEGQVVTRVPDNAKSPEAIDVALKNRFTRGYRFDNSSFWISYYQEKLENAQTDRERKYAEILKARLGRNSTVVDVGAGMGFLTKELEAQGLRVLAVDLSPDMLQIAKSKVLFSSTTQLVNSDAVKLPVATASVEAMSAESLLEHFTVDEARIDLLPELTRVLRPNGYLFLHIPVRSAKTQLTRFLRKFILRDIPDWAIDDDSDVTHRMWLSYKEYMEMISSEGFRCECLGFQLTHSKTGVLSLRFARSLEGLLDWIAGGNPVSCPRGLMRRVRIVPKSLVATSCFLLFQKLLDH